MFSKDGLIRIVFMQHFKNNSNGLKAFLFLTPNALSCSRPFRPTLPSQAPHILWIREMSWKFAPMFKVQGCCHLLPMRSCSDPISISTLKSWSGPLDSVFNGHFLVFRVLPFLKEPGVGLSLWLFVDHVASGQNSFWIWSLNHVNAYFTGN